MIPDWMYRVYNDVLKNGAKIKYYNKNNAFEISFDTDVTGRVLVIDGEMVGSAWRTPTHLILTKGKNWDNEGNLIENSQAGDIL